MGMRVNPAVQAALERAEREGRVHDPAADLAKKAAEEAAANPDPAEDRQAEKAFQADIVKFAEKHGWTCYHPYSSRKSKEGYPDLTMVRNGRIVYAELKSPTGKPSAAQETWLAELKRAEEASAVFADGGSVVRVFLWRPEDWPEIASVLT